MSSSANINSRSRSNRGRVHKGNNGYILGITIFARSIFALQNPPSLFSESIEKVSRKIKEKRKESNESRRIKLAENISFRHSSKDEAILALLKLLNVLTIIDTFACALSGRRVQCLHQTARLQPPRRVTSLPIFRENIR